MRSPLLGEAKLYLWIVVGFVVCLGLNQWFLPTVGLGWLAHQIEGPFDAAAPYLITPPVLLLVFRLGQHWRPAAAIAAVGWVVMDWYFFRHYSLPPALLGLVLIGLGVGLAHWARGRQPTSRPAGVGASLRV